MALTPAQRKANDKYIKGHYTQVKLSMPNDEADQLDQFCTKYGYTKAGFIRQAIKEKMERSTATPGDIAISDVKELTEDRSHLVDHILHTKTATSKADRAAYDAIRKNAQAARDPGTVRFDISDLLEEIEVNGNKYVKQLKMTVAIRQDVIADDEARDKVRQAINDIRQAIKEVEDSVKD